MGIKAEEFMTPRQMMRLAIDPAYVMEAAGQPADPWQADLLRKAPSPGMRGLVVSSRQAGKSTSLSSLAVWWALCRPKWDCLVIAPTLRQAVELVYKCRYVVDQLGLRLASDSATKLVLGATGGRIIALAATGHIRGMTAGMAIIDEGAWVPTSVMQGSILPMLAAVPGGGCLVSATTPAGQRGWFYEWYENGGDQYCRWKVPYTQVKRITKEYAAQYKASVSRQVWAAEISKCSAHSKSPVAVSGIPISSTQCSVMKYLFRLLTCHLHPGQQRSKGPRWGMARAFPRTTGGPSTLRSCTCLMSPIPQRGRRLGRVLLPLPIAIVRRSL